MKIKTIIICALSLIAVSEVYSQKENPRGLYKLQKFIYDDGTEKLPPFEQYQYCGDNVTLQIYVDENINTGIADIFMFNNDRVPLNYTGNTPVGEDGKGIQVFNSSKKAFTMRWYSSYVNHELFPTDAFLNEAYSSSKGISPLVSEAFNMLTTKEWKSKNKMVGVWHRRGFTKNIYGNGPVSEASEMYKIYSEKNVLHIKSIIDLIPYMCGNIIFWPCTYLSSNVIQEYQNTCVINWLNDDCYTLTWFNNGVPEIEIWDRCGLPKNMQQLFGTAIDNSNYSKPIESSSVKISYHPAEDIEYEDNVQRPIGTFLYYGTELKVRFSDNQKIVLNSTDSINIERAFIQLLDNKDFKNTLKDCKKLKQQLRLNDWGYLKLLEKFSKSIFGNETNEMYLYLSALCVASGYKCKVAKNIVDEQLTMLYASKAYIYASKPWIIDDLYCYALNPDVNDTLLIINYSALSDYDKISKPVSLEMDQPPLLADNPSKGRVIQSKRYPELSFRVQVNKNLMAFYNDYPSFRIGDDFMTRWQIIANVLLTDDLQQSLYPEMKKKLKGKSDVEKVDRLLNFVQTGLEYEYDDVVWGADRAFFAEESLFYPFCDSEDRAILFSRLVRDLVGLPVALVYYPGHLAAAVCFDDDEVGGVTYLYNGERFVVCDPTYIGASAGMEMPDCTDAKLILLE